VFVKAMRQGRKFCTLDNPRAWLFKVTHNALVDRMRCDHPHESLSDELAESSLPEPEAMAPVDALAGCLARTLGELPPEDAAILRACDIDGQTQRAYALANRLSLPATKSRLVRARQRLRKRLTQVCQVQFEPDGSVCGHVPRPASPEPEPQA
jgi:RNA polymerase sigma-70 factor, ECF subfamily